MEGRCRLELAAALAALGGCSLVTDLGSLSEGDGGSGGEGGEGGSVQTAASGSIGIGPTGSTATGPSMCSSASDCMPSPTVCASPFCMMGQCIYPPAAAGTSCGESGGVVCNGAGACVQCAVEADCANGYACSLDGKCLPIQCLDGFQNGQESDIDCGGFGGCPGCQTGEQCNSPGDCESGICTNGSPGTCVAPTCFDGVKNGGESDTDCGQVCVDKPCGCMSFCGVSADCTPGVVCLGGKCQC